MGKNKLKIGEFSRLGRVTVRVLRHYEEIDLLVPEIVDRDTGYRYYAVGQLQKIQSITTLKSLGYSLEEIRDLWDDESHFPSVESLEQKILACDEEELAVLKERRRMLRAVVASQKKLRCECPEPGYCYTIEHGGYKPQDIDIEYCEKVTRKGTDSAIIQFKDIPEVPLAACLKVFGPYDRLYQSYLDLFAFLEKEGYSIVGAPRACYVDGMWNQEDADKWLTIIQVPVEKA